MKLFLTSAYQVHPGLDTLTTSASNDVVKSHALCEDPHNADAIVFVENTQFDDVMFNTLTTHELVQKYPDKVFMYNEMDKPWDVLPGLYTCMPANTYTQKRQQAFAYLSTPNQYINKVHLQSTERQYLFSFIGAMSHKCRRRIMDLDSERAYLQNTSDFNVWNTTEAEMESRAKNYAQVLSTSHFVLCPRGIGTSSIRLFESLEAGRAPVIISDQWVPPHETNWDFAIQVKQKKIHTIPALLASQEDEAVQRGDAAREAWLAHYAPSTLFNTFANSILALKTQMHGTADTSSKAKNLLNFNKWKASGGLYTRTAVQRIRGQR